MFAQRLRVLLKMSLLMGIGMGLAACGPVTSQVAPAASEVVETTAATTPEPAPEAEQVFVVGANSDTGPLNPHDYRSDFIPLDMVYEPLVRFAADGTIQPWLAEDWEVSDDGLIWTFHLRQDVTFHDGTPFNAQAVKWNMERWLGAEMHGWFRPTQIIEAVETPDEYTVVLRMREFYYPLLYDLSLIRPVRFLSPSSVDAEGNFVSPVGTGPWRVEEYVSDQSTTFVRNEDYWGTVPMLERVIFSCIPDAETRVAALLTGEVHLIGGDYIGPISLESIPVLQRNPDVQLLTAQGSATNLLQMNYDRPPLDDIRVRQALNHAIDRQLISDEFYDGLAAPAQGLFPPNIPYVTYPHPDYYTYDLEQARALLTSAGWVPGADGILQRDGQPLRLRMLVESGGYADHFPNAPAVAEVLQAQLREIGVDVEIAMVDTGGFSSAIRADDYDLATNASYGAPYDPVSLLTAVFRSKPLVTDTSGLFFASPELDQMIDEVVTIQDATERQAMYDRIWSYLDENAAVVPIVYTSRIYALSSSVHGFRLAGTEYEIDINGVMISPQ